MAYFFLDRFQESSIIFLDISNAFQNSIIFDPIEHVYITLPSFYLEWFTSKWPDYPLPSTLPKDLILQCLTSIQGTTDAGHQWYKLISGHFFEIGMTHNTFYHGIFLWDWNHEHSYLVTEADDVLLGSPTNAPFHFLQQEL